MTSFTPIIGANNDVLSGLQPLDDRFDGIVDQLAKTGQTVNEATSMPKPQGHFKPFINEAKYGVSDPALLMMPKFVYKAEKMYNMTRKGQIENGTSITEHSSWTGMYSSIPESNGDQMNPLQAFLMGNRSRRMKPVEPSMSELGFSNDHTSSQSSGGGDDDHRGDEFANGGKNPAAYRWYTQSVEQTAGTDIWRTPSPEFETSSPEPTTEGEGIPCSPSKKRKVISASEDHHSDSELEEPTPVNKKVKRAATPKRIYNRLRDAPGKDVVDCGLDVTVEEALTFFPNTATQTYPGFVTILQEKSWTMNEIVKKIAWPRALNEAGEFNIRPTISKRTTKVLKAVMGFKIDVPKFKKEYLNRNIVPRDNTPAPDILEDPLLADLAKGVREDRLPTGAAAGVLTKVIRYCKENNLDWQLSDAKRVALSQRWV